MTAATTEIEKNKYAAGPLPVLLHATLAVTEIMKGWLCIKNASGYVEPAPTSGASGLVCFGVATGSFDNTGGSAGDIVADFEQGAFEFENSASTDQLTIADLGNIVYAADNQTVARTSNSGVRAMAGRLVGFDNESGKPIVLVGAGLGMQSTRRSVSLSLHGFREVDANSDVSNIAGNGGVLASDTTPIMRGNAAESQEVSWAAGNADPIATQISLPIDFDGSHDVLVRLWVNSGATDAASFTVESGWDGAALVSDSANDAATKSATTHKLTVTIAAADVPDSAENLTLILTPPAHATDAIQLLGVRVDYMAKLAS